MRNRTKRVLALAGVAALLMTGGAEATTGKVKLDLAPTAVAPVKASGKVDLKVRTATEGRFEVSVRHLAANTTYDLVVGGIRVGSITTKKSGTGRARFASRPRGPWQLLGFDPRGDAVQVRLASDDVLTGNVPFDAGSDDSDVACCIADDSGPKCEDRTADECAAQGLGRQDAAALTVPPCADTAPPAGVEIVCCLPDDSGPHCEDRTQEACLAGNGVVVQATSCDPNPCAAAPTPPDQHVQCCIPAYYNFTCNDLTAAECMAAGGVDKGPGSCSPFPCTDLGDSEGRQLCCLPNAAGDEIECEDRSPSLCVAQGGVARGFGVCSATTCADILPPNPDVMCCLPNLAGDEMECEDRSASACAAQGGVDKGAGICALDTCADVPPPNPDVMCCVTNASGEPECEDLSASACAAAGGVDKGAGVCAPDTCAPVGTGNLCCVPHNSGTEIQCEDLDTAARAEGIGVGWVSIVEPGVLRDELALPDRVEPIAYLCVGHPIAFRSQPMLEELQWKPCLLYTSPSPRD